MHRLFYLWFFSMSLTADAAEKTIHWAINDAPPFHILSGPFQGQGICDQLIAAVNRLAPELNSTILVMPQARISQALQQKSNLCFPCMIYQSPDTEQDLAYFSEPTHRYQPYKIITTSSMANQIQQQYGQPVALTRLLADQHFRLGYPAGRRYQELEPLLRLYPPFLARTGDGGAGAILQMIEAQRLDYTVDYPIVAHYYQQIRQTELVMLPIAEQQQQHISGAVGCARNDWGKQTIDLINKLMPQLQQDPDFQSTVLRWSGSEVTSLISSELPH